jgi:hypothetical protein
MKAHNNYYDELTSLQIYRFRHMLSLCPSNSVTTVCDMNGTCGHNGNAIACACDVGIKTVQSKCNLKQLENFIIKLSKMKFHENPCSDPPVIVHIWTDRQSDRATSVGNPHGCDVPEKRQNVTHLFTWFVHVGCYVIQLQFVETA